jgi:hypothetical protein
MLEEREELRRAVVGAADGEARIVVLYGPPGSGRRTLIAEAVECARREGLPFVKGANPSRIVAMVSHANRAPVLVLRSSTAGAVAAAQAVLDQNLAALILIHSDRPLPSLAAAGASHLTPTPLSSKDAARLASIWGADADQGKRWWKEAIGLPIGILGRLRASRREASGQKLDSSVLPATARKIYAAMLASEAPLAVPALARNIGLTEHALLDHCEVLFAERLIECSDDGSTLATTRRA